MYDLNTDRTRAEAIRAFQTAHTSRVRRLRDCLGQLTDSKHKAVVFVEMLKEKRRADDLAHLHERYTDPGRMDELAVEEDRLPESSSVWSVLTALAIEGEESRRYSRYLSNALHPSPWKDTLREISQDDGSLRAMLVKHDPVSFWRRRGALSLARGRKYTREASSAVRLRLANLVLELNLRGRSD
jgi:hypothetical protein